MLVSAVISLLKDGSVVALAAEPLYQMGQQAAQAIASWHEGHGKGSAVQPNTPPTQSVDLKILTRENGDDPALKNYIYVTKSCA